MMISFFFESEIKLVMVQTSNYQLLLILAPIVFFNLAFREKNFFCKNEVVKKNIKKL